MSLKLTSQKTVYFFMLDVPQKWPLQIFINKLDFVRNNLLRNTSGIYTATGRGKVSLYVPWRHIRDWRWVVSLMTQPLYPQEKSPYYLLNRWLGGCQSWSGLFLGGKRKNFTPAGIRIPDCPDHSHSLKANSQSAGQQIPHLLWDNYIH
jgi:hypothetical protein